MRTKLRLNLDQLAVVTFETATPRAEKGTVFGEQCTCWTNCTCPGCPTCDHTACGQNTCGGNTCGGNTCGGNTCDYTCGGDTCGHQDTCGCTLHDYTCNASDCGTWHYTNCCW